MGLRLGVKKQNSADVSPEFMAKLKLACKKIDEAIDRNGDAYGVAPKAQEIVENMLKTREEKLTKKHKNFLRRERCRQKKAAAAAAALENEKTSDLGSSDNDDGFQVVVAKKKVAKVEKKVKNEKNMESSWRSLKVKPEARIGLGSRTSSFESMKSGVSGKMKIVKTNKLYRSCASQI